MLYSSWNLDEWYLLPNEADSKHPKSYYSKAKVSQLYRNYKTKILFSYETPVAAVSYINGHWMGIIFTTTEQWNSKTTIRHIQSFFHNWNLPTGNAKFLEESYKTETLPLKMKQNVKQIVEEIQKEQKTHWKYKEKYVN